MAKKSPKTQRNSKILDLVLSNKNDADDYRKSSGLDNEFKEWHDLYRSVPKKKPYAWMSNKFYPMIMSKVETAASSILGAVFGANPPFEVRPREEGDEAQARIIQKLLEYQMEESSLYYKFSDFLRCMCIYGKAIGKINWEEKYEPVTEWADITEPVLDLYGNKIGEKVVGAEPRDTVKKVFAGPTFTNLNIMDVFVDPQSINIQDSWVIHRTRRTIAKLKELHKQYPEWYNDSVNALTEADTTEYQEGKEDLEGSMGRDYEPVVSRPDNQGLVEILEWWGDYYDETGLLRPWLIRIAAGKYVITDTRNPFWHGKKPFVESEYLPQSNDFYGIGIPEILEDLQNNLNEIVNQRNDNIQLSLNIPFMCKRGAGAKKNNKFGPGARLWTEEDVNQSMQAIQMPDVTSSNFAHTNDIERWAQEVTAVTKISQGTSSGADTATEASILQRASSERFMTIAKRTEHKAFKQIIRFYYQLNYQFIEQEEVIRIVGPSGTEFVKISPDDVRRDYDFVPTGIFTMENKSQKALRLVQFKNVTKDDPTIKQNKLNEKILMSLEVVDKPNELMRDDGEMQEIQKLATQMAIQMLAQAAPQVGLANAGKGGSSGGKIPGSGNSGEFMSGGQTPTPGVPPAVASIPPQERV